MVSKHRSTEDSTIASFRVRHLNTSQGDILPLPPVPPDNDGVKSCKGETCDRVFTNKSGRANHNKKCKKNAGHTENIIVHGLEVNLSKENSKKDVDGELELSEQAQYSAAINSAYEQLVYWKKNLYGLPKGATGKSFISEKTKLINEWSSKSPNRDICLKAMMVIPNLIHQRTSI